MKMILPESQFSILAKTCKPHCLHYDEVHLFSGGCQGFLLTRGKREGLKFRAGVRHRYP